MYSWEKQLREGKSRKNPGKPSFSSTLLDEIINSIDGTDEKSEDFKVHEEKPTKKHGVGRVKTGSKEDEEMGILWTEKEINEKIIARRRAELENLWIREDDLMFFSSNSTSSDSSGALSSSDSEFFGGSNSTKSRISCFSAPKLKPVRTSAGVENHLSHNQNEEFICQKKQENKVDDNLIKSKSRAMKIYANLNKMKQPISPGARLTNFINSLFANSKKTKKSNPNSGGFEDSTMASKSKSQQCSSTCSSAPSFSRTCLINNSSKPVEKMGIVNRQTVRFHPVNVIVDEDSNSLPRGHKSVKKHDFSDKFGRPPLAPDFRFSPGEKNRKFQDSTRDYSKVYPNQRKDDFSMFRNIRYKTEDDDEEDNEDAASDSSSELFELDHLALFGNMKKFSEELPVYENTYFDTNHVIASGLIRKL